MRTAVPSYKEKHSQLIARWPLDQSLMGCCMKVQQANSRSDSSCIANLITYMRGCNVTACGGKDVLGVTADCALVLYCTVY